MNVSSNIRYKKKPQTIGLFPADSTRRRTPDYSLIFVVMNPAIEKKPYSGEAVAAVFNPDKQHTLKSAVSISGTGLAYRCNG